MASAQQLIGLVKSHAEGDAARFYDLAMQLSATEEQKGHTRLAEQLRQWAEAGQDPSTLLRGSRGDGKKPKITPLMAPRGDLGQILAASYPEERLNDVILPDAISGELTQIIEESRKREKLEKRGLRPRQRVLLSGPPGTGKTLSASALAGELRHPLFAVMLHGLITKFMGETAQKLRLVFDAVRSTRGVYLFDEIDALAGARGGENDVGEARRVLNSFLQFLDQDMGPSIVVATTNLPGLLDRAVLRRFDLVLSYSLPDTEAIRQAMARRLLNFETKGVDWNEVATYAKGLSTADVVSGAEDAARRAVLADEEAVGTNGLVEALERRRNLQGLGLNEHGAGSTSLSSSRAERGPPVRGQRAR